MEEHIEKDTQQAAYERGVRAGLTIAVIEARRLAAEYAATAEQLRAAGDEGGAMLELGWHAGANAVARALRAMLRESDRPGGKP